MIIGIDLATTHCGMCFMNSDETYTTATIGIPDIKADDSIMKFSEHLVTLVKDRICYIDFHFNECFLPNKKKHVSVKYFLAGVIWAVAQEVHFIKPSVVREYYGFSPKTKKYVFHESYFDTPSNTENEHIRDAYLLALMGKQLQEVK